MGNCQDRITPAKTDVKRQVDNKELKQRPIYQLLDVNKGGHLIDIMRRAINEHNFTEVDAQIRRLVLPYLYNEGRGQWIPASKLYLAGGADIASVTKTDITRRLKEPETSWGRSVAYLKDWLLRRQTLVSFRKCQVKQRQDKQERESLNEIMPSSISNNSRIKSISNEEENDLDHDGDDHHQVMTMRFVCWKLEERGFVGETALHICFLLSTFIHMMLARRLLGIFPNLIYDIYTCQEYFGESALHMAIVNEDTKMVKFLLDCGAEVHERCLGNFFLPDDQKEHHRTIISAAAAAASSTIMSTTTGPFNNNKKFITTTTTKQQQQQQTQQQQLVATNYQGLVYWGEYPLSFATCLGLADCYRLLLAKGANPNRQDSNGNTCLHMAVISNKKHILDLSYELGADLCIRNYQGYTPLGLAAKLNRVEIFFHILAIKRHINWTFCDVAFLEHSLEEIDSIDSSTGQINSKNALSVVTFGDNLEHLNMFDGILSDILEAKWSNFLRGKFHSLLNRFCLYSLVTFIAFASRADKAAAGDATIPKTTNRLIDFWWHHMQTISESCVLMGAINYCYIYLWRLYRNLGRALFVQTLMGAPALSLFLVSCQLVIVCALLRIVAGEHWSKLEDILVVIIIFMTPIKFLFFCRGFKSVGPFVVMIYKMLVSDLLCFVLIYSIFVFGFAQSFFVIFNSYEPPNEKSLNYFENFTTSMMSMFLMALNEFATIYDEFQHTSYPILAKAMFLIYMLLVSVLLINMLIAMMGKTYQDIASQGNENLRQWARILLIVERTLTNEERLNYLLDSYTSEATRPFGSTDQFRPRIESLSVGIMANSSSSRSSGGSLSACKQPRWRRPSQTKDEERTVGEMKQLTTSNTKLGLVLSSTWSTTLEERKEIEKLRQLNVDNRRNMIKFRLN